MGRLITVGHGTAGRDELAALLAGPGVRTVVDVRRFPGSRRHPDMKREAMLDWLPAAGIEYTWSEDLGGRRSLPAGEDPIDSWWKVRQFAAYAAHTRTEEFTAAFADLRRVAATGLTAVLCSESVWWRCHRRIIADVAVLLHDTEVEHLMPDGRLSTHLPSDGARLTAAGTVVWDQHP